MALNSAEGLDCLRRASFKLVPSSRVITLDVFRSV